MFLHVIYRYLTLFWFFQARIRRSSWNCLEPRSDFNYSKMFLKSFFFTSQRFCFTVTRPTDSRDWPGCVFVERTEPNQADPCVTRQPVLPLARALRKGGWGLGGEANGPQQRSVHSELSRWPARITLSPCRSRSFHSSSKKPGSLAMCLGSLSVFWTNSWSFFAPGGDGGGVRSLRQPQFDGRASMNAQSCSKPAGMWGMPLRPNNRTHARYRDTAHSRTVRAAKWGPPGIRTGSLFILDLGQFGKTLAGDWSSRSRHWRSHFCSFSVTRVLQSTFAFLHSSVVFILKKKKMFILYTSGP